MSGPATKSVPQAFFLVAITLLPLACGELTYEAELRRLESELYRSRTVPRLQTWLAAEPHRPWLDHGPLLDPTTPEKWPEAIRDLRPLTVWAADECDGVSVALQRGEYFTLTVCPPGKRPPLSFHLPTTATPGYLGPFGPDAFIAITEH